MSGAHPLCVLVSILLCLLLLSLFSNSLLPSAHNCTLTASLKIEFTLHFTCNYLSDDPFIINTWYFYVCTILIYIAPKMEPLLFCLLILPINDHHKGFLVASSYRPCAALTHGIIFTLLYSTAKLINTRVAPTSPPSV